MANTVTKKAGISLSVEPVGGPDAEESLNAIKMGSADAIVLQSGVRASNLIELANTVGVTFLTIPDDKLQTMLKELDPAFWKRPSRSF